MYVKLKANQPLAHGRHILSLGQEFEATKGEAEELLGLGYVSLVEPGEKSQPAPQNNMDDAPVNKMEAAAENKAEDYAGDATPVADVTAKPAKKTTTKKD